MTSLRRRQSISTKSIKIYIQMRNHVPLLGSQETSIRINDRRRKEIKRIRAQGSCKNVSNPVYTIYGLYIGREREREKYVPFFSVTGTSLWDRERPNWFRRKLPPLRLPSLLAAPTSWPRSLNSPVSSSSLRSLFLCCCMSK